jgi:hypothetical protein
VDGLSGTAESKHRLRIVLETLMGDLTVEEACVELGVSEARFHELRQQALAGALSGLEPKRPGRPRQVVEPVETPREQQLRQEVDQLRVELQAARVRTEVALVMPHLLRDGEGKKKATSAKARRRKRGRRRR